MIDLNYKYNIVVNINAIEEKPDKLTVRFTYDCVK